MHFIIITPIALNHRLLAKLKIYDNITYINGVKPDEVSSYIKYSDVGILPYCKKRYITDLLGMHSKIYQFMFYKKPIVTLNIKLNSNMQGLYESFNHDQFLINIEHALKLENTNYTINFSNLSWNQLTRKLFNTIYQ
jgi:hypothetical protein